MKQSDSIRITIAHASRANRARGCVTNHARRHAGCFRVSLPGMDRRVNAPEIEMIDLRGRTNLSKGYAAVFATVVIWSMPSLFQYYLNRYYDPWAQNFYRYSVACLAIAPLVFYRLRRGGPRLDWRALDVMPRSMPPERRSPNHAGDGAFLHGPGRLRDFHALVRHLHRAARARLFSRGTLRHSSMAVSAGTVLGLIGAFGVIWFQSSGQDRHIALPGLFIAFTATFCWALYGVLVKRPSAQLGSIRSFGLISFITSILLLPLMYAFGKIDTPLHAGAQVNLLLIVSAVSCITLAHVLYYVAIREIGVALAQTLQLLCPAGALALSAWIFSERLTHAQLWSAAILLAGAFLAMRTKPTVAVESAENL